jgi:hypothetical protein
VLVIFVNRNLGDRFFIHVMLICDHVIPLHQTVLVIFVNHKLGDRLYIDILLNCDHVIPLHQTVLVIFVNHKHCLMNNMVTVQFVMQYIDDHLTCD